MADPAAPIQSAAPQAQMSGATTVPYSDVPGGPPSAVPQPVNTAPTGAYPTETGKQRLVRDAERSGIRPIGEQVTRPYPNGQPDARDLAISRDVPQAGGAHHEGDITRRHAHGNSDPTPKGRINNPDSGSGMRPIKVQPSTGVPSQKLVMTESGSIDIVRSGLPIKETPAPRTRPTPPPPPRPTSKPPAPSAAPSTNLTTTSSTGARPKVPSRPPVPSVPIVATAAPAAVAAEVNAARAVGITGSTAAAPRVSTPRGGVMPKIAAAGIFTGIMILAGTVEAARRAPEGEKTKAVMGNLALGAANLHPVVAATSTAQMYATAYSEGTSGSYELYVKSLENKRRHGIKTPPTMSRAEFIGKGMLRSITNVTGQAADMVYNLIAPDSKREE